MSNIKTVALIQAVKSLLDITRNYGSADLIPDLIKCERENINIISDIQNGLNRTEPDGTAAEDILDELRSHYNVGIADMSDTLFRLETISLILNGVKRVVDIYERDIEGKEGTI